MHRLAMGGTADKKKTVTAREVSLVRWRFFRDWVRPTPVQENDK